MNKKMTFSLDDDQSVFSHLLLEGRDVAKCVTKTPLWKDDEKLVAEVQINGVSIDPSTFQTLMEYWIDSVEDKVRNKYSAPDVDKLVEERAQELLKERLSGVLGKLGSLGSMLDVVESECDLILKKAWS